MPTPSLHHLMLHELRDLYGTSHRIRDALDAFAERATSAKLRHILRTYKDLSDTQIQRLETAFSMLGTNPEQQKSSVMEVILQEGDTLVWNAHNNKKRDAAIIQGVNMAKEYKIAGYGAATTFANILHQKNIAKLLKQSFQEEEEIEKNLQDLPDG